MGGKKLIQECGLQIEGNETGQIVAMIHERKWWEFVKQSKAAMVSIVKDFYAKAKEAQDFVVQVQ